MLVTGDDGFVSGNGEQGVWCFQTRMLSRYRWLVNGKPPTISTFSAVEQHRWLGYYLALPTNWRDTETQEHDPAQQTIELKLMRVAGNGFLEEVELTNHTQIETTVELELEVDADFADPSEAQGGNRQQKGKLKRRWREQGEHAGVLEFDYTVEHAFDHQGEQGMAKMHRALRLHVQNATCAPRRHGRKIAFTVHLAPHESWRATIECSIGIEGQWLPGSERWDSERVRFLADSTSFFTSQQAANLSSAVQRTLERSRQDLFALRLFDLDQSDRSWTFAAGVPSYLAFFGRDVIAASWEANLLSNEPVRGSLAYLPVTQGKETDDWRDEQPGRMVHELHTNPLAVLNFSPHSRYYGDITASIHYPLLVSALWHWTGDKEAVRPFVEPALKALRWADENAHVYGDGLYRFQTRSERGEKNQGWKDSSDAIVYEDGKQVSDPLGTCEMQGFVYASKLHFSEALWWLDEADTAKQLYREAEELKKRFNEKFWMEQEQFIGMGIDASGRLIRSIASDPGHCLASGIIDESLVRPMVARFLQDDLFSGWGIRTLSANHPAFNPFAYHRGAVWPVENGVFVLAMARYGLHAETHQLAKAFFETACLFEHCRLPEVFAGHRRDAEHPFPGLYPRADSPQAWSASAPFVVVQALLGLYPYAPLNVLFLDPWLPEWLPFLKLANLRVGNAVVDLRFERAQDGSTNYHVDQLRGDLHVIRQPSPWSLTTSFGERVKDSITSLLPGH